MITSHGNDLENTSFGFVVYLLVRNGDEPALSGARPAFTLRNSLH